MECISKGKAHKRYEFGVKVSVGTSSRGGWHVAAQAHPGNPYDGHTLKETLEQVRRMVGEKVKQVFVDRGYRGHGYEGEMDVHVDKQRKGKTPKRLWQWMKRRAVVEPGISHLKHGHRMNRNRLKGTQGDQLNAVLSAAGMNFRKLLRQAGRLGSTFGGCSTRQNSNFTSFSIRTLPFTLGHSTEKRLFQDRLTIRLFLACPSSTPSE